jgi:hypothetical protein
VAYLSCSAGRTHFAWANYLASIGLAPALTELSKAQHWLILFYYQLFPNLQNVSKCPDLKVTNWQLQMFATISCSDSSFQVQRYCPKKIRNIKTLFFKGNDLKVIDFRHFQTILHLVLFLLFTLCCSFLRKQRPD